MRYPAFLMSLFVSPVYLRKKHLKGEILSKKVCFASAKSMEVLALSFSFV